MGDKQKTESGQALILIVLGIAGLLGFAALAIDGGRIYTDRRNMQNASDTSSLTGAGSFANYFSQNGIYWSNWDCNGSWYFTASAYAFSDAINRADSNGFSIDTDISDGNGVTATCDTVPYIGFTDKYIDVTTYITEETPSSFAQFVFGGPLVQTVESTARIRPQTSGVLGNAIVALNPANCQGNQNGAQFNGNDTVYINGGGVFSNGCMGVSGTSLDISVDNGGNTYIGSLDVSGGPSVDPWPAQGTEPLPDDTYQFPPPNCSGLPAGVQTGNTFNPGIYSGNTNITSGGPYTFNPGLYCFNGRLRITGGTVNAIGVTIYMISGDFEVGGNATVTFEAPGPNPDPSPALPNMVIYMAASNSGIVSMLGSPTSTYLGTVYAPKGNIEIGGTSGVNPTYSTQLIGWNVFVHGNTEININFQEAYAYQLPPRMDLQK